MKKNCLMILFAVLISVLVVSCNPDVQNSNTYLAKVTISGTESYDGVYYLHGIWDRESEFNHVLYTNKTCSVYAYKYLKFYEHTRVKVLDSSNEAIFASTSLSGMKGYDMKSNSQYFEAGKYTFSPTTETTEYTGITVQFELLAEAEFKSDNAL